jgi:hypothetical protein
MDTLREVVIDEARWPRMFAKLRRAGMYRSCGCTGCGDCQAAARRFITGLARSAHAAGSRNARYPIYSRSLGERQFHLTVDTQDQPLVVDITTDSAQVGPSGDEELWSDIIGKRANWPTGVARSDVQAALHNAVVLPELRRRIITRQWRGNIGWSSIASGVPSLDGNVPLRGLYLVIWPSGAYLGSARGERRTIQGRLREHRLGLERFDKVDPEHRIWWLPLSEMTPAQIESIETALLTHIHNRIATGGRTVAERLRSAGFTNAALKEV